MSISIEEVRKLAALSRINLSPEEETSMQVEIASILRYVEEINKADFPSEAGDISERRNVWREDGEVNESGRFTEKLLANAPARERNHVKVKKIL